jgi:hypothetical protein
MIFRVIETAGGWMKVEVLKNGTWMAGRIGMVGLRLADSTTKLSPEAVLKLPA